MSAMDLGQLNIRPEVEHELYRNDTNDDVNVSVALSEMQTPFALKCGSDTSIVTDAGVTTLTIPRGGLLTLAHGEKNIMQPVRVQISVG